ncbi:chromosome segregation protein (SepB) [Purpureocillium lavendulum]|uniref:Chromosome segregation protein (SepB) n=1 Tax=Purpureocillium lavendulum TaxID=1247861 RepID=A0AB34FSI4_9HYPO|nr:chromosome segregation protein (SepB) [Purpureocillium lavendulum]
MHRRDGGDGHLAKRDVGSLGIFWIIAGIFIAAVLAWCGYTYLRGGGGLSRRRGKHGGGSRQRGRSRSRTGSRTQGGALERGHGGGEEYEMVNPARSGLGRGHGPALGETLPDGRDDPSKWTWFGLGFACGYGAFVVMLGLFLGHQMKNLPWLWEAETAQRRREEEARAAAAAYVPPPPPAEPGNLATN